MKCVICNKETTSWLEGQLHSGYKFKFFVDNDCKATYKNEFENDKLPCSMCKKWFSTLEQDAIGFRGIIGTSGKAEYQKPICKTCNLQVEMEMEGSGKFSYDLDKEVWWRKQK